MCGAAASAPRLQTTPSKSQLQSPRIKASPNLHKKILLPLRSYWRLAPSQTLAYGSLEVRCPRALFGTKMTYQFCALTRDGMLLLYIDNERGVAIDLLTLHSQRDKMSEKKICGIVTPQWKVTLQHHSGERVILCVWGKQEIARWRSALYRASHPDQQDGAAATVDAVSTKEPTPNKESSSTKSALVAASISKSQSLVAYWNHPAAGRQMTSPKLFRALSQLQLLRQTAHESVLQRTGLSSVRLEDTIPPDETRIAMDRTAIPSAQVLSPSRFPFERTESVFINTVPCCESACTVLPPDSGMADSCNDSSVFHTALETTHYTNAIFDLFEDGENRSEAETKRKLRSQQGWGEWTEQQCALWDGVPLPEYLKRPVTVLPPLCCEDLDLRVIVGDYLNEMIAANAS